MVTYYDSNNFPVILYNYSVITSLLHIVLVQVGNGIDLEAVGLQFEPYQWLPCGVTWDSSLTVQVIKLWQTSALQLLLHHYYLLLQLLLHDYYLLFL